MRAMRLRDGKSISEIARLTSLSRNTIKKWLKASAGRVAADVARWLSSTQRHDVALIHGRLWSSATAERVEGFCTEWQLLGHRLPKARIATARAWTI